MSELHLKNKPNNNSNVSPNEIQQQTSMNNSSMGLGTTNDDDDTFDSVNDDIDAILMDDHCKRIFVILHRFLIQLTLTKAFLNCC